MHCGNAAGYDTVSAPSLPEAQTGSTSWSSAYCSALCVAALGAPPPRLRFRTSAPLSTAQMMPLVIPAALHRPSGPPQTLMASSLTSSW
jgi:hypothetical protein